MTTPVPHLGPVHGFLCRGHMLAILNVALGVALVLGGPLRTSSPSFAVAQAALPIPVWGLLFIFGGAVCFYAVHLGRVGAVAISVGAGIHAFWAAALWMATSDPKAALTGAVVYTWIAVMHVIAGLRLAKVVT